MGGFSDVERTFLFLLICVCLGACFIAAFWQLEQVRSRWHARRVERAKSLRLAAFRRPGDRNTR
jgi:hypothetical protein